ncbi:hypothetical protein P3W45_000807 [Vairimorpha bombi]
MPIPTSLKLSVLFKAVQKDFSVDDHTTAIFINYIRCLIKIQSDDILMVFKTSKLKYFKYMVYWKEYMSYLIKYGNKIDKVVDEGIRFINVKEFGNKKRILEYLIRIKNDSDRDKYIVDWDHEWISVEDIRCNDENFDVKNEDISLKNFNKENIQNYGNHENIKIKFDSDGGNMQNIKIKFDGDGGNIKFDGDDGNIKFDGDDGNIKFDSNMENRLKVQFNDESYSPLLKKNLKYYPNTPITDDVHKYSYKDEEYQGNVIKCKIEDVTLREDTQLFKIDKEVKKDKEEFFYLNNKKLLKINIIGKGGSSKVYKVFYGNEFYALKIINIEMDSTLKDLLLEEIDLLKRLKDVEGIIKMIDYEVLTDNIYILLEYGESVLSTFMKNTRYSDINLHRNRIKYIWQEILLIVLNIHEKRIIHGDLKPANFVFVKNKLKIIDFGISKTLNNNTTRLDLDMVCGTLNYCAPELFFENKKRRSSDVWSLGIILHELWYGKTPLDSYKTYLEKKENIINIKKNLKMIGVVDEVISRCLDEDCRKRPTVKELLKDNFICSNIML